MTIALFRRRQHTMLQKVAAFLLVFAASLAVADPAPLPSQPAELPVASTTADTRIGPAGNASLKPQPVATLESTDPDATIDVEMLRRFNELRSELLDHRAKTVDWWLDLTAVFLTLFGVVAVIVGYFSFKKFSEIEAEARGLVREIKEKRDEAESLVKGLTAKTVHDDPDKARKATERVQKNPTASPVDQTIAAAVLLQEQGEIEESIEKWRAVAIVSEDSDKDLAAQAWFSVGYLNQEYKNNVLDTAIDAYDKAVQLKPDLSEAYNNRSVAKNSLGRHEEALADYDEVIRLKPNDAEAYNNRGVVKNDLGRHEEALADYDKAIRLKPTYANAYNNRGNAKDDLGLYQEALADYDKAIRLKPDFSEAYNNRGFVKSNIGHHEEAVADFDKVIQLKPDDADAYKNRGVAKNNLGRHEEALRDYDEAIRLKSDDAEAYSNRGVAKNNLGRHEEALTDYDEAIRLKPNNSDAYNSRGNAKSDLGQHEEAIADYNEAIQLKPDLAVAYYNRGDANSFLNRVTEARQDFEIAAALARDAGNEALASDAERALKKLSDEQDP